MITKVLINGDISDGRIPVTDSSVLRGDGCFEVLKAYGGRAFATEEHLDRLERSASALQIPLPRRTDLASWIETIAGEVVDGAIRVVVTRGASVPGLEDPANVIVFGHSWNAEKGPARLLPVTAPWHSSGASWRLAGAKTISYAPNLAATREANDAGFDDALLVSEGGDVLEGPTFSVAWVVEGKLETPGLELAILDSITRRVVLDLARGHGFEVSEGTWPLARLAIADEVVALSTIREVQPVVAVGDLVWEPGPVTEILAGVFAAATG